MIKCSAPDCAREAKKRFLGRSQRGRPDEECPAGIPYCAAHYEQRRRGMPLKSVRPRGASARVQVVEDCAAIAEFHGHAELAKLLRHLKS